MWNVHDGAFVRYNGKYYRVLNGRLVLIDGRAMPDKFGYFRYFGKENPITLGGVETTIGEAVKVADSMRYVVLWFNTRDYGGPEEGGWFYDTGEPQKVYAVGPDEDLDAKLGEVREMADKRNVGRRSLGSVLSTGRYSVSWENEYPASYPSEVPYYC